METKQQQPGGGKIQDRKEIEDEEGETTIEQIAQRQYVVSETRCPALHNWTERKQGSGPKGHKVL